MRIIAGESRGRIISAPEGIHTRPTLDRVRENIFNMIQYDIPGSRVLDLFAGSGALSLEALSRGSAFAVLNDKDRRAYAVQQKNILALGYDERCRQLRCDWRAAIETLCKEKESFDLVFLDPPYAMLDMREVFSALIPLIGTDTLIVLEHQSGEEPLVPECFSAVKRRSWGFCAAEIYRLSEEGV